MIEMKKVVVIWMWYVGFPLACAISKSGKYEVIWLDIDPWKVDQINGMKSPIEDEIAEKDILAYPFPATLDATILADADIAIICVPTPINADNSPNLGPVKSAVNTIAQYANKSLDVIVESTINPWVCDEVVAPLFAELDKELNKDYFLAHCPERINPGDPKRNVYNINRNVWASTPEATHRLAEFYRSFLEAEVYEMKDIKHAEATKIVENIFRDINIAFVNELAKSFDKLWLDIVDVIKWSSNKPFAFLAHYPGCGVGGHCIPVDPYYLIERASQAWFDHKFLSLAREINNSMPEYTVELLMHELNRIKKSVNGTKVWLLGMSYKRDIADLRESPAFDIKTLLEKSGAEVEIYEPYNTEISTKQGLEELLSSVDALVIATNHTEFTELICAELLQKHCVSIVIDGKNCLDKESLLAWWIHYKWIGR